MPDITIHDEVSKAQVVNHISNLSPDKRWIITVKQAKKTRTLSQNRLNWKWINEIADLISKDTGMDDDEIHAFFKEKFLPGKVVTINNETAVYKTTTKLTTAEMSEYMDKIYVFASRDLGLFLPFPGDGA